MSNELDDGSRNLLWLAGRDGGKFDDGWVPVSAVVWPLLAGVPDELLERRAGSEGGGHCRITEKGQTVLEYC